MGEIKVVDIEEDEEEQDGNADTNAEAPEARLFVKEAKSARSTCRTCGEFIPRGGKRVGMRVYAGGSACMQLSSPLTFWRCTRCTGFCEGNSWPSSWRCTRYCRS
mmetsp:Transcript_18436/g.47263  ORF Transcript_18436/g.47263 Transcript_18436/m.47263 type:complete len:105 (+) Transcript_18436:32-346(+)